MSPTFVDLFCGCGGLSLGFLQAGFKGLLAVDNDPEAVQAYNHNLRGPADRGALQHDLSRLTTRALVRSFLSRHGVEDCDVLVGGPPCQSFSVVGRNKIRALVQSNGNLAAYWRKKTRERTALCSVYARFLEVLAPRWFVFENVPAIRTHESYAAISKRFRRLKRPDGTRLKYEIMADVYLASDYGVPQTRRRFLMVGRRVDVAIDKGWAAPPAQSTVTVAEALDDLPPVGNAHEARVCTYHASSSPSSYVRAMRAGLPASLRGRVVDHICRAHNADDVQLFSRMAPGARFADPEVQRAIREINPEHLLLKYAVDKFADKLHKLDPERPAWTVTAHLQKDCYKFIHHRRARTVTVREAARVQSFPDWFDFLAFAMGTAFRLIGNAVPPRFAKTFAESIIAADPALRSQESNVFVPPCDEAKRERIRVALENMDLSARESVRRIRAACSAHLPEKRPPSSNTASSKCG